MRVNLEDGFSLLEVLVTITIVALAFGALFPIFVDGEKRSKETEFRQRAYSVAVEVLNEAHASGNWQNLPRTGEYYGWKWILEGSIEEGIDVNAPEGYPLNVNVIVERRSNLFAEPVTIGQTVWVD